MAEGAGNDSDEDLVYYNALSADNSIREEPEEEYFDARRSPIEEEENLDARRNLIREEEQNFDARRSPTREEEDYWVDLEREATRLFGTLNAKKNFAIFLFGKTGSGKSSLAKAIIGTEAKDAPKDVPGCVPSKTEATPFTATVGNVDVTIIDTRGLCDGLKDTNDDETVQLMGDVLKNDRSGIIIICLEMYQRVDESTLKPLVFLHRQFGREIWPHVIIALTKADRYEKDKWLEDCPKGKRKQEYLVGKFHEEVEYFKAYLQTIFTGEELNPEYQIGMTQCEFDELQIPVIPTSQLRKTEMSKMNSVGREYWFDELLLHCCARDKDAGIIQIHPDRMANLPNIIPRRIKDILAEKGRYLTEWARKRRMEPGLLKYAAVIAWTCHWWLYYKNVTASSRFQAAMPTRNNPAT